MKHIATAALIAAATMFISGCSTSQELTREQRVEKLRQQAKTADRERSKTQRDSLREGEREMARDRVQQNSQGNL